ncbi:winged helix-turn-helix transcriptional regulator [Rhodococcus sp. B50]|uniref:winged helix-turn-helix transcriptional regulator n=1 Tax=Rhodococcus sp. B50 TaxID=2682847 RepID=UPI001BD2C870|nr:helix-turn-helix domain-containing protein [Rhodococcus sp. B50]MBS9372112.1 HTH-type transcriptional activator HxlR [Rhodococcus sp. B50]
MGASGSVGYCSFTKAIEHLGDRWSLLVVRQLGTFGPQGFNDLATGLPGRISRSVLADRLRRLEMLGVVSRCEGPHPDYRLTDVGLGLMTPLGALRTWAEAWLPDDPEMVERDPDVVLAWLAQRVDRAHCPVRPVVLEFRPHQRCDRRYWLVVQRGAEPYGCLTDPLLDPTRYVYVESSMPALLALARGRCDWSRACGDGSVTAAGDPELVSRVGEWFRLRTSGATRPVEMG